MEKYLIVNFDDDTTTDDIDSLLHELEKDIRVSFVERSEGVKEQLRAHGRAP